MVDRIFNLFINTGNVTSLQKIGRPKGATTLYQYEELVICEMVLRRPAIHLKEIAREIENKTGTCFSIQSLCAAVHRLGFTRKKVIIWSHRQNII
jgi:transposase